MSPMSDENGLEVPLAKRRATAKSINPVNAAGVSQCFRVARTSMYVSLAPSHINNPINGIKAQHLDPLVMTYYATARGVVLSYSNVTLASKDNADAESLAKVTESSPFAFMWVSVDLLLWSPQVGDTMEGFVYMQTSSHIGLLVHDTFNASIKYRNIPQDWEFVPSQADEYGAEDAENKSKFRSFGCWLDGSGTKVEGKVSFVVRAVHTSGRMLSIEGTLLSPESELDAQPVSQEQAMSGGDAPVAKHITFDEPAEEPAAPAREPDVETMPRYEEEVANSSSSEEDESD